MPDCVIHSLRSNRWLAQCVTLVLVLVLVLVCACRVYEPNKIESSEDPSTASGGFGADASAADPSTAGGMSTARAGAAAPTPPDCRPNLEGSFALCPEICPEQCNGLDDDCDDRIDEAPAPLSCAAQSSQAVCTDGQCVIESCLNGARDCDSNPRNGCEIAIDDANHCGTCGRVCSVDHGEAACRSGECAIRSCRTGFADCDERADACETETNTLTDCGGCGRACTDVPNAAPSCESGSCGVGQCGAGFGDCDGRADNGCETSLGTLTDCTACGMRCEKASCAGGVCTAVDCGMTPGLADCDRDEASCEVDLRTDTNNCGRCGFKCAFGEGVTPHGTVGCSERGCAASCDAGWGDCDGNYRNGCEQALNTNTHCGACRRTCNLVNAMESCSTGTCELDACEQNFADCDRDEQSCEVPVNNPMNCGTCGRVCSLPHATPQCPNRSCEVARCDENWGDCDGRDDNGCEQDVRPLGEGGGLGPCLPDDGCTSVTNDGRRYYICPTARGWQDARMRCRQQRNGDLAQIGNEAEANFLAMRLPGPAWIGLNDQEVEGLWVWTSNEVPIWQGGANGTSVDNAFTTWASGEPNGSGNCGQLYTGGNYDDTDCAALRGYVCEIQPDACPNDPKNDPGQCGCSVGDDDSDGDGFANCKDMCANDRTKRAPGDCGCGNSDADRDGDDAADCVDNCDDDPNKREPGACGCGTPDTDSDGDGTPNCNDGCPNDRTTTASCFPYDPANIDRAPLSFQNAPATVLNCGVSTINTADPPSVSGWCGSAPALTVQNQPNGLGVVVVALSSLRIDANNTLRVVGTRPVVLAVNGDATISGTIDASANGATAGPGGNWSCAGSSGGDGTGDSSGGGGGGGGGGFGSAGGVGGTGDDAGRGAGGTPRGNAELSPLLGGCNGGLGGGCGGGARAAGGGALQLSAAGAVNLNGGAIRADGAPGTNGCGSEGGAGGGGSGGAVLIEARTLNLGGGTISANGGEGGDADGGGGNGSNNVSAPGGNGANSGSNGGGGGGGGAGRTLTLMR